MSRYVLYRRLRFGSPLFNSFLQNPTMALISSPVFSIFIFVFNTLRYVCDFLYESDNTFLSTYTTSFFIIAPHTRRMATRCYIHFEKFDYMRHSFHNIWKNIIHYEYRGKSFIYVFFKKSKSGISRLLLYFFFASIILPRSFRPFSVSAIRSFLA